MGFWVLPCHSPLKSGAVPLFFLIFRMPVCKNVNFKHKIVFWKIPLECHCHCHRVDSVSFQGEEEEEEPTRNWNKRRTEVLGTYGQEEVIDRGVRGMVCLQIYPVGWAVKRNFTRRVRAEHSRQSKTGTWAKAWCREGSGASVWVRHRACVSRHCWCAWKGT